MVSAPIVGDSPLETTLILFYLVRFSGTTVKITNHMHMSSFALLWYLFILKATMEKGPLFNLYDTPIDTMDTLLIQ